jgi:hypothetical protein
MNIRSSQNIEIVFKVSYKTGAGRMYRLAEVRFFELRRFESDIKQIREAASLGDNFANA